MVHFSNRSLTLICILISSISLTSFNHTKAPNKVIAAQPIAIPPPPAARADRYGIYNWNVNDAAFPDDGTSDRLNWAANKVAEMGTRTIRVALTARDIYKVNPPGNPDIVQIALSPAYDKLFRDPRFQTIMLTVYTRGDMVSNWADGFTQHEYNAERDEIKRLGEHLLENPAFGNKKFIILNWEGDNAIYYHSNKRNVWDYFTNWIRARAEGVKLARQSSPSGSTRLFSGLEYNSVVGPKGGQPCGTPVADPIKNDPLANRCVIDYVAPQVDVDYYSYSAWSSTDVKLNFPDASLKQGLKTDLEFALGKVRAKRHEVTANNFIVGEFGFDRTRYGECNAANHINEMFDVFEGPDAFQVSYVIFWQVIDNAPAYGGFQGGNFGLFRVRDGKMNISLLGDTFQKRMSGQQVSIYSGCPRIRRPPPIEGVLNQEGRPDFRLNPDTIASVYVPNSSQNPGGSFSANGNKVHFDQNSGYFQLPRDNDSWWYESASQVNFSLPPKRRPGDAHVYVTDSRGYESNGQGITLTCADCPQIRASCGLLNATHQTLRFVPENAVTINGSLFSPTGNRVVIEQRETSSISKQWTLTSASLLTESTTQIIATLPDDLIPDRDMLIYVVDSQGRESNDVSTYLAQPCRDCEPRLRPCQSLVSESGGDFTAGTSATLFGDFGLPGNKVVFEQVDQQNRVYQYTLTRGAPGWTETDVTIRFKLPENLFAGRLLYYVINPEGLESRAHEITIAPSVVSTVSAANFRGPSLAAESIVAAFGTAMATVTEHANSTPLPTDLAGTRVIIEDGSGTEYNAPLFFVSPNQINFHVPPGTPNGAATVKITSGFGSTSTGVIQIVKVAPGLFSQNATGKGVAAAVLLRVKADGRQIYEPVSVLDQATNLYVPIPIDLGPAEEQVFLVLFGTGFRARSSLSAVNLTVGNAPAEVTYAGPQNLYVGLDQINLRLSRNLAGRGDVDISVNIDGQAANIVGLKFK